MKTAFAAIALSLLAVPAFADCKHAYFPTTVGNSWVYQDTDGSKNTMTVTKVEGNKVTLDMSVVQDPKKDAGKKKDDTKITLQAECSADGIRTNFGGVTSAGQGAKMTVLEQSGASIPPEAKLKAGQTWNEAKKMKMEAGGAEIVMNMDQKVVHKVVAIEKVKTPAGTFDAVKIQADSEATMTMEGPMAGMMPKQPPQKSTTTTWIVKGVGMVKSEGGTVDATGKPVKSTSELVSYKVK